jgi:hypothetical protein
MVRSRRGSQLLGDGAAALVSRAETGEELIGEPDERRETAEIGLVQPDPDAVPGGEPGHHEQAHPLRHIGVHRPWMFQLVVRAGELRRGHPDAPVSNVDQGAAGVQHVASDIDRHACRREQRCVLSELGEQVHQVVDRGTAHRDVGLDVERDTFGVLHFRHRGLHQVRQCHRLAPSGGRVVTGQDEEVLRIAVHVHGDAIHPGQIRHAPLVLLGLLEVLDKAELTFHQGLAAVRQVHEDGTELVAECGVIAR